MRQSQTGLRWEIGQREVIHETVTDRVKVGDRTQRERLYMRQSQTGLRWEIGQREVIHETVTDRVKVGDRTERGYT